MDLKSIESQLKDQANKFSEESKAAAEHSAKVLEEYRLRVEKEQSDRAAFIKANEEKHARRQEAIRLKEESDRREEAQVRYILEQEENAKIEAARAAQVEAVATKRRLDELVIAQERADKAEADALAMAVDLSQYIPETGYQPSLTGDADAGTEGLEHGPEMSYHLKFILRQGINQRKY